MSSIYITLGIFLLATAYNYFNPKNSRNYTSLDVEDARNTIKSNEDLIVLDVRNSGEYMTEHIRSTINIPLKQIEDKLERLSRDKDILVYCQTGARSIRAVRKLEALGYTRILHMHQGLRGWKKIGLPTEMSRSSK